MLTTNMKVKFLTIIFVILLLPIISSQVYEQGKSLDLKIPFEVNGSVAAPTAWCNVSVYYPNETFIKNNNQTTNLNNGLFLLTLNNNETSTVGEYTWVAFCCEGSYCAAGYDNFEITRTGKETPDSMPFLFGIIALIVFGVAVVFMSMSFKMEEPALKIFFMLASFVFLIGAVGVGVAFANDNNISEAVGATTYAILITLGIIFLLMVFYFMIRVTVSALESMRVKKGLSMGVGHPVSGTGSY